jgi:hypothetical protein
VTSSIALDLTVPLSDSGKKAPMALSEIGLIGLAVMGQVRLLQAWFGEQCCAEKAGVS